MTCTTKQLHQFFEEINQIHPTKRFTISHTMITNEPDYDKCEYDLLTSIPFLDTYQSIENRRQKTERKLTGTNTCSH